MTMLETAVSWFVKAQMIKGNPAFRYDGNKSVTHVDFTTLIDVTRLR